MLVKSGVSLALALLTLGACRPAGEARTAPTEPPRTEPPMASADPGAVAAEPAAAKETPPVPAVKVSVSVTNQLAAARSSETLALKLGDLKRLFPSLEPSQSIVVDSEGHELLSQWVDTNGDEDPDELVFQSDFAASETKVFGIAKAPRKTPSPDQFKVYGRFVRERHDDFAWENDRIAHRMYGTDLETWAKEPLTSSGVDVWTKRVRRLVVNDWYMTDDYHHDHGEGADLYSVGKSRGIGGIGLWGGDKLYVSRNFTGTRVLANGPIRLVFELTYPPFAAGTAKVTEIKRVTLDAGQSFDRFESSFKIEGKAPPLNVAVGIGKHKESTAAFDAATGVLRAWEPLKEPNGHLGLAVVIGKEAGATEHDTDNDYLLVTRATPADKVSYYAGFGWDHSGDFADAAAWNDYVQRFAADVASPLSVRLSVPKSDKPQAEEQESKPWSARVCDSILELYPDGFGQKWTYDNGLVLKGFWAAFRKTGNPRYFEYIKRTVDKLVKEDGSIEGYKPTTYNIDDINMGKVLFPLYAEAKSPANKERYKKALDLLRSQMKTHPRTQEGGFWHKNIYPHQMWLDGVYMASPFLAEYAATFHEPALFDDVTKQILLAEKHLRDKKTGLLYHGWDESKHERWADPKTGTSSQFWGRGVGWYAMALVDVLELLPTDHPERAQLRAVLTRLAAAVASVQDRSTGVWWQVLDAGGRDKNYLEASASSMFVYALSKAVKNGWLDAKTYGPVVARGYKGLVEQFADTAGEGGFQLKNVCKVAGLGGTPYRDGTYDYYTSTEVVSNDPKGVGPFLLASVEQE
ncbi:MAG TPA: glycoside hydrolase family 88 protein [Polyangiaceae bacterium]